jgi:hypothetical protein
MNGDRPAPLPTSRITRQARLLGLTYDLTVLATAGSTLFFMFAASDTGMYAAAALGAVAAFTLGYSGSSRRQIAMGPGVVRYARLWVAMTLVSAAGLVNDRWQPLVLFALASVAMVLFYTLGAWLGSRLHKRAPSS